MILLHPNSWNQWLPALRLGFSVGVIQSRNRCNTVTDTPRYVDEKAEGYRFTPFESLLVVCVSLWISVEHYTCELMAIV